MKYDWEIIRLSDQYYCCRVSKDGYVFLDVKGIFYEESEESVPVVEVPSVEPFSMVISRKVQWR